MLSASQAFALFLTYARSECLETHPYHGLHPIAEGAWSQCIRVDICLWVRNSNADLFARFDYLLNSMLGLHVDADAVLLQDTIPYNQGTREGLQSENLKSQFLPNDRPRHSLRIFLAI